MSISYSIIQSKEECEHLINLAKPYMHKSTVVDSATGKSVDSRLTIPYSIYNISPSSFSLNSNKKFF